MIKHNQKRGFIALLTTIIISAILISLTFSVGSFGFSSRIDSLHSEFKIASSLNAESCAQIALLRIGENYSYTPTIGGETISIDTDSSCILYSVVYDTENNGTHTKTATITTQGVHHDSWTTLITEAKIQNPTWTPSIFPSELIHIISETEI